MSNEKGFLPIDETYCTRALTVGSEPEQWNSLAVVPPITLSTVFKQTEPGEPQEFLYGRYGNPSRKVLEKCLADLEGAKYAFCYASGMGSINSVLSIFRAGDHILCGADIYGGTYELINKITTRMGIEITFVDTTDLSKVEKAIKPNTKLIYFESPSNPTLRVTDLQKLVHFAKSKNLLTCIDNTFLTSYFQKPLDFGIDIVMHSATKYLNGHTDVLMGVLITNCEKLKDEFALIQGAGGCVPSPFDCFLVKRSLKTLVLRMEQHQKNGFAVARFLEKHPLVEKVVHPGLPSHPQFEITKKQTSGHSGIVTFYIKGATREHAKTFLKALKLFVIGGSVGGLTSLAESPSIISHRQLPVEEKQMLGITENCIRLSVGVESINDLIHDLDQALSAAFK